MLFYSIGKLSNPKIAQNPFRSSFEIISIYYDQFRTFDIIAYTTMHSRFTKT